jgi:hypothetical protein
MHAWPWGAQEDAGIGSRSRLGMGPAAPVWVQHIRCRGCGLHLGLRITHLGRLRAVQDLDAHTGWEGMCACGLAGLACLLLPARERESLYPPH